MVRTSNAKPVEELSPLLIRHLEGPIFIYVGGISISIFTFVLELSYHKISKVLYKTTINFKNPSKKIRKCFVSILFRLNKVFMDRFRVNKNIVFVKRNENRMPQWLE